MSTPPTKRKPFGAGCSRQPKTTLPNFCRHERYGKNLWPIEAQLKSHTSSRALFALERHTAISACAGKNSTKPSGLMFGNSRSENRVSASTDWSLTCGPTPTFRLRRLKKQTIRTTIDPAASASADPKEIRNGTKSNYRASANAERHLEDRQEVPR